jgi:hypothetical protein
MIDPKETDRWQAWVLEFELERGDVVSLDHFRLIEQGRDFFHAGNMPQARVLFAQARDWALHERMPDARRVQGEALVYLGDVARMTSDQQCQSLYEQARFIFEALSPHNLGVVSHRLATWHEQNGQLHKAWREYNLTLMLWRELTREHGRLGNKRRYHQYVEQLGKLEAQLNYLVTQVGNVNDAVILTTQPTPADAGAQPAHSKHSERIWDMGDTFLSVIPIYSDLAAGSGLWQSDDDRIQNFAEVDKLWIEGQPYKLINLLDRDSMLRLSRGYVYGLAKAIGNSMNLARIEDGDYVLFRKLRDLPYVPNHGEIVVASVVREDQRYRVVKRYCDDPGAQSLESQSTEDHQPIFFSENVIDVIGQVIAVLKRIITDSE